LAQAASATATRSLAGRVALVTGGTGALGRAVVRRLLAAGARVHVTWRREAEAADLQAFLGDAASQLVLHQADVSVAADVASLFDHLKADPGRLDVLACVAGGFTASPLEGTSPEAWDAMIAVNATSVFLSCRAAVPLLRASGHGRIVNVAARPALEQGAPNMGAYAASKAAVLNLTYSLAKELVRDRITVNAIVPSIIDTAANRAAMPRADTSGWLKPEEIAEVVAFLAGDAAAPVTGTAVNLSRG
jgi:NAD(P)-dependent dehydrogenase (short-subunit alcohol dehydrogenase family)